MQLQDQKIQKFRKQTRSILLGCQIAHLRRYPTTHNMLLSLLNKYRQQNKIIGRDSEIETIRKFILNILPSKGRKKIKSDEQINKQKVLIIQGPSGTGKSLCVKKVINQTKLLLNGAQNVLKFIHIHPTQLLTEQDFYLKIVNQLHKPSCYIKKFTQKQKHNLENYFKGKTIKSYKVRQQVKKVLVIDTKNEANFFTQKNYHDILYRWPQLKTSNLYIILISSEQNLQKKLPFDMEIQMKFNKLTFDAFDSQKFQKILKQKLKDYSHLFSQQMIQTYCKQLVINHFNLNYLFLYLAQIIQNRLIQLTKSYNIKHLSQKIIIGGFQFTFDDDFIIKSKIVPFSKSEVMNVFDQIWNVKSFEEQVSLVDEFGRFPQCYKIVLMWMINYFLFQNPKAFPLIEFSDLYKMISLRMHVKSEKQLREILYDLKDLGLIIIRYHPKHEEYVVRNRVYSKAERIVQMRQCQEQQLELMMSRQEMIDIHQQGCKDQSLNRGFWDHYHQKTENNNSMSLLK